MGVHINGGYLNLLLFDEDLEENQEHSDDDKLDIVYENEIQQCIMIGQKVQNHCIVVY